MSHSLFLAARLMEAGYSINIRIPSDTLTDGPADFALSLFMGAALLLQTSLLWLSWSMLDTLGKYPRSESHHSQHPCLCLYSSTHTRKTSIFPQTFRPVTGSLDFLIFLIIAMRVMCRIYFRLNASRDAYSSVLISCVATKKSPWHSTEHMATTKSHASTQPCSKRHPAQALEVLLHFGRFL